MEIDILLSKQNICNDVAAELNLLARTIELSASSDDKAADNLRELAGYIRTPDDNETKPIVARAMQEAWAVVKETCQRYNAFGRKTDDNRLESIVIKETETYVIPDSIFVAHPGHSVPGYALGKTIDLHPETTYNITLNMEGLVHTPGRYLLKIGSNLVGNIDMAAGMEPVSFSYTHKGQEEAGAEFNLVKPDYNTDDIEADGALLNTLTYSYNRYDNYNLQLVMPNNFNVSVTSSITSHANRHIVDTVIAAVLKNQKQDDYAKYLTTAEKARKDLLRSLQARNSFGRVQHDWM